MNLAELPIVQTLLAHENPTIRFKARTLLLGESADAPDVVALRRSIVASPNARALLGHREADGTISRGVYRKWQGPLWTLVSLAHIDYPLGDTDLYPIRGQTYDWLFAPSHLQLPHSLLIPGQEDRFRRCVCQEAYVAWATIRLGIADERTDELVRRIIAWQWPDGGWNCDRRPEARKSSFHESFMALRVLSWYGRERGDAAAAEAARRASEIFLARRLYRRISDGAVMHPSFVELAYPNFYHYNILSGLVIMAEGGWVRDPRCADALDLLQRKQLPDGGFPLERPLARTSTRSETNGTWADWGPAGKRRSNPFVTCEALYVLQQAGRLGVPPAG